MILGLGIGPVQARPAVRILSAETALPEFAKLQSDAAAAVTELPSCFEYLDHLVSRAVS
jgi:hypothetical protein